MAPEDEDQGTDEDQPVRDSVDEVPLGIRKPRSPKFDSTRFSDSQRLRDDERERDLLRKVEEDPLEHPDVHQDYEIQDGDEYDRHLEGITSVNALKEFIARAKDEVEQELELTTKPFSVERMDELMVFSKEAILGYGEEQGYAELRRRVHALILEDARRAMDELDRKKEAYLRSAGK